VIENISQSVNQREICRAPLLYGTSSSANSIVSYKHDQKVFWMYSYQYVVKVGWKSVTASRWLDGSRSHVFEIYNMPYLRPTSCVLCIAYAIMKLYYIGRGYRVYSNACTGAKTGTNSPSRQVYLLIKRKHEHAAVW